MDKEFDGSRIMNWAKASNEYFHNALAGSEISDEESLWVIANISKTSIVVSDSDTNSKQLKYGLDFLLNKTVFISALKTELLQNINLSRTPIEIREDDAIATLHIFSINASDLDGSATVIKFGEILHQWLESTVIPTDDDRLYLYEKSKKSKSVARSIVSTFVGWRALIEDKNSSVDPFSRLLGAVLYRICGKLDESLGESEIIDFPQSNFQCNRNLRSMICCDRAAVYLDKFEKNHNNDFLIQAKKYLDRAYANEPNSEEVSHCYQRYQQYKTM